MLESATPIDKIWAINPPAAYHLNVDDAKLVEVLISRNILQLKMGSKPIGHLVYYIAGLRLGFDSYRYAAECVRSVEHPAYPCETIELAQTAQCSAAGGHWMSDVMTRSPSQNNVVYKGTATQCFLVPKQETLLSEIDKAFDADVTFNCHSMKETATMKNLDLDTASEGTVTLQNFDLNRRTIVLIPGFEREGGKFEDVMLAGNSIFNYALIRLANNKLNEKTNLWLSSAHSQHIKIPVKTSMWSSSIGRKWMQIARPSQWSATTMMPHL